jgi:hypothetical protein
MRGGIDPAQTSQKFSEIEQQIQTINSRIDDLNAHMNKEPVGTAPVMQNPEASSSIETLTHMQSDLAALSSAVSGLQVEVKQAGSSAAATQQTAQATLAAAIAFIQLRSAAESGRGFISELAGLRSAAPDDSRFRETLDKLVPYAEKGAPVIGVLREEFMNLEAPTTEAIDKASAQNWWQRILAELKGLISIRPLHGNDATGADAEVENALAVGDVDAAITAAKTLPPEAQDVLKDWLAQAQARAAIDTALHDLSDRFVALAGSASASNPRNEP